MYNFFGGGNMWIMSVLHRIKEKHHLFLSWWPMGLFGCLTGTKFPQDIFITNSPAQHAWCFAKHISLESPKNLQAAPSTSPGIINSSQSSHHVTWQFLVTIKSPPPTFFSQGKVSVQRKQLHKMHDGMIFSYIRCNKKTLPLVIVWR